MAAIETRDKRELAEHDQTIAGIDALEIGNGKQSRASRFWSAAWPKVLAAAIVLGGWQIVVWSGWKDPTVLPGPTTVLPRLVKNVGDGSILSAVRTTMSRAVTAYAMALAIGGVLGITVARNRIVRSAIGSMITGLQTMPSIAWFPLAIVLFKVSDGAIMFVVVLGAAPSIANGVISGIDHIPPNLLRAGRSLGARGLTLLRHVIVPAALPGVVAGLKQGWAFAWRSLMAGEIILVLAERPSLGGRLTLTRDFSDYEGMMAMMVVIFVIGVLVDALLFGRIERSVRKRFGLIDEAVPGAATVVPEPSR